MYNPALHFHFIGIGGSGMSGLAEILLSSGFRVSGSDLKMSEVCERLVSLGAEVSIGHRAENVPSAASLVVYSSAVTQSNPEMREAKRRKLPVVRRAEVLAELMRMKYGVGVAGSHGKTTTTSMTAAILDAAQFDPTVVIGGQVKALGTGGRLGKGDFLVAETDESDRSFLLLKPTIAIVTNIDDEHLNAYRSRKDLEDSFVKFVESIPFYGLAVLCIDDPTVKRMALDCRRRVVTYGFSVEADLRAVGIKGSASGMEFGVVYRGAQLGTFKLPMLGRHLVQNCLAAIAVGIECGITIEVIREALASFGGVKRRLEVIGQCRGITVVNDYGHHPTEIRATLRALRECLASNLNRLIVLFQPHRYTRTEGCWNELLTCFKDADLVMFSDIYAASEQPIPGITSENLCRAVEHPHKVYIGGIEEAPTALVARAEQGDVIVTLGAGSVGQLPEVILQALSTARPQDGAPALAVGE